MADSKQAFKVVIENEGGFVQHKLDKGGATKYGISLHFLMRCGVDVDDLDGDGIKTEPCGDLNNDGKVDVEDIRLFTPEMAEKLFAKHFWQPFGGDKLKSQKIATKIADMAFTMGVQNAVMQTQRALMSLGCQLVDDGVCGDKTRAAIDTLTAAGRDRDLLFRIREFQKQYYVNVVRNNPSQAVFFKGWENRADLV